MSVSGRNPFATLTTAFERRNISQSALPWARWWQTNPANANYSVKVWNPVGTNQTGAWSVRVISPIKKGSTVGCGNRDPSSRMPALRWKAVSRWKAGADPRPTRQCYAKSRCRWL